MQIERVLYNGNIVTLDNHSPRVPALALARGRVVAWGSDDDMLALTGAGTVHENLGGRTVIPGLTDAHMHWEWTTRTLSEVNLFEVPDKAEALRRVAERAASTPVGVWITGFGWIQDLWEGRAFPTAADLDSAAPEHPVYLRAKSAHAAWVNSAALRLCGIDRDTPDPDGGEILRTADGTPSGVLLETAMELVRARIPSPTVEQLADQMQAAQALAHTSGLTGIHDFDNPSCLAALQVLRERGTLSLRVVKNVNRAWLDAALESGIRWGFGDEWIRFGGLKLFADGALGPRTAWMLSPYEGEPNNHGICVTPPDEMHALVSRASAAGLPATIHAIGDRAVRQVLDVYAAVRREEAAHGVPPGARRHRIEHVQLIHPDDAHRLAQLDLIASMQPIHATSDYVMADRYWGARSAWSYNARVQLDRGARVAFGSDSPIEPFEPFKGIHAAVTRRRPDGSPNEQGWHPDARLTLDEALHGFTTGAAYAGGTEAYLGRLAPGYLADLVVLDRDPYRIPPQDLWLVRIVATMVHGVWRYGGV